MVRFEVTAMLAEGIRLARIQNNIASKELAAYLDRSPAYISKLEKGEVKSIEDTELTPIFSYIISNRETLEEKLDFFLDIVLPRYPQENLFAQLWLTHYAWVICKYPIPSAMVEEIQQWMNDEKIPIAELIAKINANVDLPESERNDASVPVNQWREHWIGGEKHGYIIKLKINPSDVKDFISGKMVETNYLLTYVIVRFMYWMTRFPEAEILSEREQKEIDDATSEFLHAHEFLSITDKLDKKRTHALRAELNMLFPNDTAEVMSFVNAVKTFLESMKPLGTEKSTAGLTNMCETLNWDAAFALKVMQMPFAKLEGISFTNKKQLLAEIELLIQRYQDMPATQRGLESYD